MRSIGRNPEYSDVRGEIWVKGKHIGKWIYVNTQNTKFGILKYVANLYGKEINAPSVGELQILILKRFKEEILAT